MRTGGRLAATSPRQALLQNKSEQDNGGGAARDGWPRQQYVSLVAGMNMK